jgi:hypothetical protein
MIYGMYHQFQALSQDLKKSWAASQIWPLMCAHCFPNLSDERFHHSQCWDGCFDCDDMIFHAQDTPPGDLAAEDESHSDGKQPWRSAGLAEALHIVDLARSGWEHF